MIICLICCVVCTDGKAKVAAIVSASTSPSKNSGATAMSARGPLTASLTNPAGNSGPPQAGVWRLAPPI
eukprot:2619170-Pyramimonas_sp.AAC.3